MAFTMLSFCLLLLALLSVSLTVQAKPENDDDLYSFVTVRLLRIFVDANCFITD